MLAYRSRDGARGQEVSGPHVAPGDAVVRQLLLHGPVEVLKVGPGVNSFNRHLRFCVGINRQLQG